MLNYIWGVMIVISVIFSVFTGNSDNLSTAVLSGAQDSITLVLTMCATICFWSGIMQIAEKSGLDRMIAFLLSPVLKVLFPALEKESEAYKFIGLNVSANLLGLGNAATPFGLEAMKQLQKLNDNKKTATNEMVVFVVLNTASIQLIPTTVAALRQKFGAVNAFDILPCVWITSVLALIFGLTVAIVFNKRERRI